MLMINYDIGNTRRLRFVFFNIDRKRVFKCEQVFNNIFNNDRYFCHWECVYGKKKDYLL